MAQLSTAISDGVLALASIRAGMGLLSVNFFAALGFCILAAAASFGVARFGLSSPSWSIINWHKYLSWLTTALGLPFIACGYFRQENFPYMANLFLAAGLAMAFLDKYLSGNITKDGANLLAGASMIVILADSIWRFHAYTFIGAAIFIIAALVVKTEGYMNGFKRVDIFHYAIAISVIAFTIGFNDTQTPIFYRG